MVERRNTETPKGVTKEDLQMRESYISRIRGFLKDAPVGSPRLLLISDLAAEFDAEPIGNNEQHRQSQAIRKAVVERDIRNHTVMIPGYRKAQKDFHQLSSGKDFPGDFIAELIIIESDIAGKKLGSESSTEEVSEKAASELGYQLNALVDERLEQIDNES